MTEPSDHPICQHCYDDIGWRYETWRQLPPEPETCCLCAHATEHGIYVRRWRKP